MLKTGFVLRILAPATLGFLATALLSATAIAQPEEGLAARHHRLCVTTMAQPSAVEAALAPQSDWRPMFAASDEGMVGKISANDPLDVVMARIVNTRGVIEAICSVQRRGADFETLKAEFETRTALRPVPRYSSRTVALYIARDVEGQLEAVARPDLEHARRDGSSRIFSLSRMGSDALIVVSVPQAD